MTAPKLVQTVLPAFIMGALAALTLGQAQPTSTKPPPQGEWDKATADITGTDAAARDAAVAQVKAWIKGGWVSSDLWRKWMPALVKANQHQEVADLALLGILGRPGSDAIANLAEFRLKALLAANKPDGGDELLAVAKSYYNVCDPKAITTTSSNNAVNYMVQAFARGRKDDAEIGRKFRTEQAAASAANAPAPPDPAPPSILSTVKIDDAIYQTGLDTWKARTKYADQVAYGNLLLLSDHGADAEKLFRELTVQATTIEDMTLATDGIAKALRAEDGNARRSNLYIKDLATHPSTLPHTPPKVTVSTKPGDIALP